MRMRKCLAFEQGPDRQAEGVCVLDQLKPKIGEDAFRCWVCPLELERVEDGQATVIAPTRFLRDWVVVHYADRLLALWQAQDPGLARLAIIARGPYAGSDAPDEMPDDFVQQSDRDEVVDRILELLEKRLRSSNAQPGEPKSLRNKGGRPPYDEDVEWWFLLAEDLADHRHISLEARFKRLKELCDSHGVAAPGFTTFKSRRNELLRRLGRKGRR